MKKPANLISAFTLLEVIFVIVILGIVASIGSEIISKVYENYIVERALYRANIKTELALQQIANRLRYAIPSTVGYRTNTTAPFFPITNNPPETSNVLQWVGYDAESFQARASTHIQPGWNGFIDLDSSTKTALHSPGSNLTLAHQIIRHLSNNQKSISNAFIYFPDGNFYSLATTSSIATTTLNVNLPNNTTIYERYKLAWSSYAISFENGNLYLYHRFTPTRATAIPSDAQKTLLISNISNFRFKGSEGSIRIKLCLQNSIGDGNVTSCKEQVVF